MANYYMYGEIPASSLEDYGDSMGGLSFFSEPSFDYSPEYAMPVESAPLSYFDDSAAMVERFRQEEMMRQQILEAQRQAEIQRQQEMTDLQRREDARRAEEERARVPTPQETVGITPEPPAAPGPVQEFVGTPFMPSFDITPVTQPVAEAPVFVPREESVPIAPLSPPVAPPPEAPVFAPRGENVPVAPLTTPSAPPSDAAPSNWLENMKRFTGGATPSPLTYFATPGTGGSGLQEGTPQKTLSDLLKANKFSEAFKFAEANNLQQLLAVPAYLKDLRDPFTKEEAQQFLNAAPANFLPNLTGTGDLEKFTFDPLGASERGAFGWMGFDEKGQPIASETGFPRLDSAWKVEELKPEPSIFEKIFKAAALATAVAGGAQLLGGLSGAGGATAGGAAGGAGAGGAGALTGVVPAGVLPGSAAATLGGIPTFTVATGAGGIGAGTLAGAAGTGALASQLGGGAAAPTTPATTTAPVTPADALQEVLVTGSKVPQAGFSAIGPTTLASTDLIRGVSDIPVDIYGQPVEPPPTEAPPEAGEAPPEGAQAPLSEILVTAPKPLSALDIAAGATVPALSKAIADMGYRAPAFEGTPIEDIPEVVVQGTAPKPIDLTSVVGPLTAAQVLEGFTQPQVDPFTGEIKEPPKTQTELDAIQKALETGAKIPGTETAFEKLSRLLSNAQRANSLIKLLGTLGALGAGSKAISGGGGSGIGTGGFGGALPKYQFQRTQLQPQIDYYRYGLGPEAKFFEDKVAPVETGTTYGPDAGIVNPKDQPVFAQGGLTAYAKGGSNKSRYVAGPGSGRDDKIPALLSDGEYVIDAETLALLGDGSTKEGAKRMDQFRANIRKHKGRALSRGRISPNAKSPSKYMGGGLT